MVRREIDQEYLCNRAMTTDATRWNHRSPDRTQQAGNTTHGAQYMAELRETSSRCNTLLRFSRPPMTRSVAASKSTMLTSSLPPRAAMSAASLQTFAMSAPAAFECMVGWWDIVSTAPKTISGNQSRQQPYTACAGTVSTEAGSMHVAMCRHPALPKHVQR